MEFVVNEWLPEYYKPDAPKEEKEKLEKFLVRFIERNDKIFVRRPSAFYKKIHRYKKDYQNNLKVNEHLGKFINFILINSDRCFIVDDGEFELPEEIRNKLREGGNTESDMYLFEAASATESKTIVTTDAKLKAWMENEKPYRVVLLDDFLTDY
jgi:hypothetical protein